tara:strand:- start:855 stop:1433 length:579 start_codon:yes stop_codon:yes gene_type:complete
MDCWASLFFERLKWNPNSNKNVLEIGSFEGFSTCWIITNLLHSKESKIVCIDSFEGGDEHKSIGQGYMSSVRDRFYNNISETGKEDSVRVIENYSDKALLQLIYEDDVKYDFIYIDGSHKAIDVLTDLVLSFRLLKINGICICDDYTWSPDINDFNLIESPKMAIDSFTSIYSKKIEFVPIPSLQFSFIRRS